jgi:transcriptional regulator with XRE-family HTH domain
MEGTKLINFSKVNARDIANTFREERLKQKLSDKELAKKAQIPSSTLLAIEYGYVEMSLPQFIRIAIALGFTLELNKTEHGTNATKKTQKL